MWHHFCWIPLIRSESFASVHIQKSGMTPGQDYQEAEIQGQHQSLLLTGIKQTSDYVNIIDSWDLQYWRKEIQV